MASAKSGILQETHFYIFVRCPPLCKKSLSGYMLNSSLHLSQCPAYDSSVAQGIIRLHTRGTQSVNTTC